MVPATLIVLCLLLLLCLSQLSSASAEADLPAHGRFTKVSGGRIHWVEEGSGPPIVMIHGLGGNLYNFTHSLSGLLAADARVISIDRPGCGWSERDDPALGDLAEQARMIAEFIAAEGLEKPLIVGHSLGGSLALALALDHSEQISGLVLLCPATQPVEKTPRPFKGIDIPIRALVPPLGHGVAGAMAPAMERQVLRDVFAPDPVPEDFGLRGGARLARRCAAFISAAGDLALSRGGLERIAAREAELSVPIAVLFGGSDAILKPEKHGRAFAERTGATYGELDGRGHMIPVTAAAECADFIRAQMAQR
ncbi:Pimeloyl-ACP methyl ester carboxylesterase [Roseivivax lentus]|uniref:Pimeloyl-ACP methyl ester carboxylesterase n=1 Tax=Roseivivax lentus TaxID=633194 RepID=A0A1N7JKD3_9RHOB|nr:alpha/beta fold hydrolase [Roseivivax lentus]SIS49779.1 Pimeloyl-ACP methyl ester carboxylesterase [Roseivivax lentus]